MATIKDIAKLAGVSYATVSIVLSGRSAERKISQATQERVLAAAKELRYTPNVSARSLKQHSQRRYKIGIYWPGDYRSTFLSRVIAGIQVATAEIEDLVDIVICPYDNDRLHLENGLRNNSTFHGAIVAAMSEADLQYLEETLLPIPVVLMNRISSKYSTVTIDNRAAGRQAAMHLIDKGIQEIGLILSNDPYVFMAVRSGSFQRTCLEQGVSIPIEHVFAVTKSMEGGYEVSKQYLQLTDRPKGIYCDCDAIARGFLFGLWEQEVPVPQEVEVIAAGMDSRESCEFCVPPLTTLDIPYEAMAENSVKTIMGIVRQETEPPVHRLLDFQIYRRQSSP